jgi:hypothetical protein
MRRRQRTFAELLTRSLAAAGLVYALVIAYAVPATLLVDRARPGPPGQGPSSLTHATEHPTWRATYAQRFPDCVDLADWDSVGVPAEVVVLRRDGEARRMSFDEAYRRATSPSSADDVWTIGACRGEVSEAHAGRVGTPGSRRGGVGSNRYISPGERR